MTKGRGGFRRLLALDWDGVITPDRDWRPRYRDVDVSLIEQAWAHGYAVAIVTCSPPGQVADELRRHGIRAYADHELRQVQWHGGPDGREVLVTGRKVWADAFVDDRAIAHRYGQPTSDVFTELDRRAGYHSCTVGPRHWGPDGAAGLLPWTEHDGSLYVLLSLRGKGVQDGGTWSTFGGATDTGETALDAALREAAEEVSGLQDGLPGEGHVFRCGCGWTYTTFPAYVPSAGRLPRVSISREAAWETSAVRWIEAGDAEQYDLHAGLRDALPHLLDMISTQLRRAA